MRREEAIKRFQRTKKILSIPNSDAAREIEAIDMAIEALEREPSDDLISRADAIRVVEKNSYRMAGLTEVKLKYEIAALPSADRPRGEWIPCTERMPGDGKWAIWCSNDGVIGIARFKEDCYNHFYPNGTSFGLEDAVAWMPLPEPYKGGDDK